MICDDGSRFLIQAECAMALVLVAIGCSAPPSDNRFVAQTPPFEAFPAVGDVLETRCGSLDCHGNKARSMRVYGANGLRLGGETGNGATTADEHAATYEALVMIEPEMLSQVFLDGGTRPERWIVISKGRGREAHKGEMAMRAGDDSDRCIISWLAEALDTEACQRGADFLPPMPP